jgi:hypothetical protein
MALKAALWGWPSISTLRALPLGIGDTISEETILSEKD